MDGPRQFQRGVHQPRYARLAVQHAQALGVLVGVFTWNEFFLSVIFLSGTPNQPLSVAIYSFVGEFSAQWNLIFATVLISIAPILAFYLFAQRQLIKGFAGGIRG